MKAYAVTVTDEATLLVAPDDLNRPVWMQIVGNTTVYIGGADVSSTQGFPIVKHAAPIQGGLPPHTPLYGICSTGASGEVRIIIPPTD